MGAVLSGLFMASTSGQSLAHASAWAVFAVGAALILTGAAGVILLRNPVHCALMLVITLFGVALEFIDQQADFLAAVQIIVYAGAVVILFLFVIMFLGVDRKEAIGAEATRFQKPLALLLGAIALVEILALSRIDHWTSGVPSSSGQLSGGENVAKLGQSIYTGFLLPFEMTAALLVIAVVAAVVLSKRHGSSAGDVMAEDDAVEGAGSEGSDGADDWAEQAPEEEIETAASSGGEQ